jgi:hypothetical protein
LKALWKEIELNEMITSLLAEIERRETIERDLINMAAHELRTRIQPVLGQHAKNNTNADGATIAFSLPQPVNSQPAQ